MTAQPTNRRVIYGRRQGHRLHPRQAKLVETLLPQLQPDLSKPPADWFAKPVDGLVLEIGFGGGEHLAARAAEHPHIGHIGCEPFLNGVAKLLIEVEERPLDNVAVHDDDARALLAALPDACLDAAYLLYPDPWPKKRHNKRRFVNPENLAQLFRVLKPQGRLLVASDIADYLNWTLAQMKAQGGFDWQASSAADWHSPPQGWPGTRYEKKALAAGRRPGYLTFLRRAAAVPGTL